MENLNFSEMKDCDSELTWEPDLLPDCLHLQPRAVYLLTGVRAKPFSLASAQDVSFRGPASEGKIPPLKLTFNFPTPTDDILENPDKRVLWSRVYIPCLPNLKILDLDLQTPTLHLSLAMHPGCHDFSPDGDSFLCAFSIMLFLFRETDRSPSHCLLRHNLVSFPFFLQLIFLNPTSSEQKTSHYCAK